MPKALVIAEHNHKNLLPTTYKTITAAQKLADEIILLVAGQSIDTVTKEAAQIQGVKKVLQIEAPQLLHPLAEDLTTIVLDAVSDSNYILAPSSTFGKNFLPRVAAKLNVGMISDVIEIIDNNTFKRPIYAGNAIATEKSLDKIKILTIRATNFAAANRIEQQATIKKITFDKATTRIKFEKEELTKSVRPELTTARIVVSGGRALKSAENFKLIEQLADRLQAAIGASRAAVDAGYVPNDYQVGQTGKIVAPELYIAVGISGAIQHIAGMKDSKVIVAINQDPDAPIFQIADYGLVGDLFKLLPEMLEMLDNK